MQLPTTICHVCYQPAEYPSHCRRHWFAMMNGLEQSLQDALDNIAPKRWQGSSAGNVTE